MVKVNHPINRSSIRRLIEINHENDKKLHACLTPINALIEWNFEHESEKP